MMQWFTNNHDQGQLHKMSKWPLCPSTFLLSTLQCTPFNTLIKRDHQMWISFLKELNKAGISTPIRLMPAQPYGHWKLPKWPCRNGHLFRIQHICKLLKWPFGHGHFNFKSLCHHDWPLHFCRYACTGTYISSSPTTFLAFVRVWIWQVWVEMNEKWLKLGQANGCNKWWWINVYRAGSMVGKIVWIYVEEMMRSW